MRHLSIAQPGMLGSRFPEVIAEALDANAYKAELEHPVPVPAEARAGDLVIAFSAGRAGGTTTAYDPPAGFTRLHFANPNASNLLALDVKQLSQSEPEHWTWTTDHATRRVATRVVILRNASAHLGEEGQDWAADWLTTASSHEWYGPPWVTPVAPALALVFVHAFYDNTLSSTLEPPISAPEFVTPLSQVFVHEGRLYRSKCATSPIPAGVTWDAGAWGMPTNYATHRVAYTVSVYPK